MLVIVGDLAGGCKQRGNKPCSAEFLGCLDFEAAAPELMKSKNCRALKVSKSSKIGKPDKCSRSLRGGGGK